jgi:hypothetical protein
MILVRELLAAMPDPAMVDKHWRATCRELTLDAAQAAYTQGYWCGYHRAISEVKATEHELVRVIGGLAETLKARWHLCCLDCRRGRHRPGCRRCQDRTRETFGQPYPGDYTGGPVEWNAGGQQ